MRSRTISAGMPAAKATTSLLVLVLAAALQAQSRVIDQRWQFSPDPKAQFTAATVDRQAKWRPDQGRPFLERSI